ncbi:MFS transporter [Agromyces rhizosphaerae]|uniref:MFS transporter n=1 Tax=Agromyces rhizosphaerae TaxID=88374 RepID=A0A9W6CNX2_9MICO|nr:MFS transporter [Agromyces rhizosphaerae]GLI26066.1 MFS transporter [Agromyces rhizosphaerae]
MTSDTTTDRAAEPSKSGPSLWRDRAFLQLWAAQTVSQFGAQLATVAVPVLAIVVLGASEFEVGLLNAATTAAFLVVGLPAGAWIDRMRKRRVMIAADLVRALALATIPLLWALDRLEMWHAYLVALVIGTATVFFDVSYQSVIPVLVRRTRIGEANAKLEATAQVARIGGPAIGGGLLAIVSAPFMIAATAVTYLVSFLFLLGIRDDETPRERTPGVGLVGEIREGLSFVWHHRLIRRITLNTALANLFGTISMTLMSLLVLRELGLTPAVLGLVLSIGSVGGLLGAVATPWITRLVGEGTVIPLSTVLFGLSACLVPLSAALPAVAVPLLIVAEFGFSFSVLVYNIAQVSFRQRVTPHHLLGRMNASIRFVVWGVMPLSALLAGALAEVIGVVPTMWVGAICQLLAGAVVVFSPFLGMRTLPEADEES